MVAYVKSRVGRGSAHGLGMDGDPWQAHAACGRADPGMFETPSKTAAAGGRGDHNVARAREAIAMCHGCPVRVQCHEDAEKERPKGMIRAGIPYDDSGLAAPQCLVCHARTLAGDSRSRYCENHARYDMVRLGRR